MNAPSKIHEPTGKPATGAAENPALPWRSRDLAVRDAAAQFAAMLDDTTGRNEQGLPLPERRDGAEVLDAAPNETDHAAACAEKPKDVRLADSDRLKVADRSEEPVPNVRQMQNPSPAAIPTEVAAAPSVEDVGALDAVCRQIADRILVSCPTDSSAAEEVRLMIRDGVLTQTEIRISRQAGELHVSILTGSAESYALLAGHKRLLDDRLAERLGGARVEVVFDAARRDDDRQGGSRGRRNPWEEQENHT